MSRSVNSIGGSIRPGAGGRDITWDGRSTSLWISAGAGSFGPPHDLDRGALSVAADLTIFIDVDRQEFVQSASSLQPLTTIGFVQGEQLNVAAQMLQLTGDGLSPFVNIDPTGWTLAFGLGYIDATGTSQLIALANTSALTAISGLSGNTALAFVLDLDTTAASALLAGVYSSPIWIEAAWNENSATTALLNKCQVQGTIKAGFLGVGLPAPV